MITKNPLQIHYFLKTLSIYGTDDLLTSKIFIITYDTHAPS